MNAATPETNRIDDEQLLAYLDAELPEPCYQAIEDALAVDATLRTRLQALVDSGERLRAAFHSALAEPVPPALIASIQAAPLPVWMAPAPAPSRATPTAAQRQRLGQRLLGWLGLPDARPLAGMALASMLMLAIGGWLGHSLPVSGEATLAQGSARPATAWADTLAVALEVAPSGRALRAGQTRIELLASLRGADGRICREYSAEYGTAASSAETGLACRTSEGQWAVAVRHAHTRDSGYDTASSVGHEIIDRYLAEHLHGAQALDAEQEQALIQQGWQALR